MVGSRGKNGGAGAAYPLPFLSVQQAVNRFLPTRNRSEDCHRRRVIGRFDRESEDEESRGLVVGTFDRASEDRDSLFQCRAAVWIGGEHPGCH
jgi:hypothetical protein